MLQHQILCSYKEKPNGISIYSNSMESDRRGMRGYTHLKYLKVVQHKTALLLLLLLSTEVIQDQGEI